MFRVDSEEGPATGAWLVAGRADAHWPELMLPSAAVLLVLAPPAGTSAANEAGL